MRGSYYCWVTRLGLFLVVLVILLRVSSIANAADIRPYNGKINKVISGVVLQKLSARGICNTSLISSALSSLSTGLSTSTKMVGLSRLATIGRCASLVSWPALLTNIAVSTCLSGAISLGQNALIDWTFNKDNTITLAGAGLGLDEVALVDPYRDHKKYLEVFGVGRDLLLSNVHNDVAVYTRYKTFGFDCPDHVVTGLWRGPYPFCNGSVNEGFSCAVSSLDDVPFWRNVFERRIKLPNGKDQLQMIFRFNPGRGVVVRPTSTYVSTPKTADLAIADVPEGVTGKSLSPEMLAAIVNAVWKVAKDSPALVSWSATNPVTPQDVTSFLEQNSSVVPTVGDFFSSVVPEVVPQVSTSRVSTSGFSPATAAVDSNIRSINTSGVDEGLVENGNDSFVEPTLESIPDATSVLSPLLGLFPDLRDFKVPAHASVCPTADFCVFGKNFSIDSHCGLIEQHRQTIGSIFSTVWALVALFVFLRT